jgi:hypothetical protein
MNSTCIDPPGEKIHARGGGTFNRQSRRARSKLLQSEMPSGLPGRLPLWKPTEQSFNKNIVFNASVER